MVMEPTTIIFLIIALSIGFVLAYFLRPKQEGSDETGLKLILQQINELNRVVDSKIGESAKQMNESVRSQLGESAKLIREVTQGLTKLDETNRQVVSFADQLQNLQDILKNPKQRGILGEYYLETLLKNVLAPSQYQMQYGFKNGEVVDAVVFVKDKIIPVDSKFSSKRKQSPLEFGRLSLVQVANSKGDCFLFDVTVGGAAVLEPIKEMLQDSKIVKVMHDCRSDSDLLFHAYGITLQNVFDTQVAYAVLLVSDGQVPPLPVSLRTLHSKFGIVEFGQTKDLARDEMEE